LWFSILALERGGRCVLLRKSHQVSAVSSQESLIEWPMKAVMGFAEG
jgi:hypothetical protein